MKNQIFSLFGISILIFRIIFNINLTQGQFYNVYPSQKIVPNTFPLNSTSISIAAFVALTSLNEKSQSLSSTFEIICLECQKELINSNPDLLPDMKIDILYYDSSEINTSTAAISALEFSLTSTNIASLGPDSSDLLLTVTKYLETLKIASYSATQLSTTFSSSLSFPNLRAIAVSDYYLTDNYVQLMKFFGWTWVAAAFADDDIGQSGRYTFSQLSNKGVYFPCFYIFGTQNNAGLSALTTCIQNYTDIKILLLWGSANSVSNAINYLYESTNLTYLTFVINPTAAKTIGFKLAPVPTSFYQGTIFLSENYDETGGFYDCVDRFLNGQSSNIVEARQLYENTFNCLISNDTSIAVCPQIISEKKKIGPDCRCLIDNYKSISKPFTQTYVLYRDVLQAYALALNRIIYNCSSLIGDFCKADRITGEQLLDAVSQNSFVGFSGLISYNITRTTNRVNGTLNVYQIVESEQTIGLDSSYTGPYRDTKEAVFEIIGFMTPKSVNSTDGIFLDQELFNFKTGGDTVPISIPTPETTDLSSGFWPCFVFSLSIIGLLLNLFFLFFIIWKWNTPVVRKAGHVFLLLMLLGVGFIFTANLLWCVQVSLFICNLKAAFCYLGISITCGTLFAKSVEYYIIFSNCRKRSYDQAMPDRVWTFVISFGLVFLSTLLWYLLYILVSGPILCQSFQSTSDFYYWYLGCLPIDTSGDNIYHILNLSIITAFNFFALILLAISWDLTSVYSLARCILFVECNLIVLLVSILPLYYALPEYPNYTLQQFIVRSLSSSFASFLTVLFIFAPLVYSFYYEDDENYLITNDPSTSSGYDPLSLN